MRGACYSPRRRRLKQAVGLLVGVCIFMICLKRSLPGTRIGLQADDSELLFSRYAANASWTTQFFKGIDTNVWNWPSDLPCPARQYLDDNDVINSCSVPIVTMLTSIHDCHGGHRERIHNNTLINWSSLGSCVQLVLYLNDTDSELANFARKHRWRVEPVPYAIFDIPVLSSMFLTTFNLLRSTPLYLYANSDILFDLSLITTLRALLCAIHVLKNSDIDLAVADDVTDVRDHLGGIFAVGRRTNVNSTDVRAVQPAVLSPLRNIQKFNADAQDYFITTSGREINYGNSKFDVEPTDKNRGGKGCVKGQACDVDKPSVIVDKLFSKEATSSTKIYSTVPLSVSASNGHFPWHLVPNFVIGRPGYDNWLVAEAVRWNVTLTMDLTRTVLAVHQTGLDGEHSGFTSPLHNKTICINYLLAGKDFVYEHGLTGCVHWSSSLSLDGSIAFVARDSIDPICTKVPKARLRPKKKFFCFN